MRTPTQPARRQHAVMRTALVMAASTTTFRGVDNLLAAEEVEQRLAAGATPLRIEADFVTCSQ